MSIVKRVELQWRGRGQVFEGRGEEGEAIVIDGDRNEGQGPMDVLLLSLAACMGIDVLMILERSRVPVDDLSVVVEGERNEDHPRRFNAIRIIYRIAGPEEEHQRRLDRAVSLSRDKYCSVLHSLRTDIDIDVRVERG
jgi:putative redox protein